MNIIRKVVVAADSFKGSLGSAEVAEAVRDGMCEVLPGVEVVCVRVADGGEGTMEAIMEGIGGADGGRVAAEAAGPLGRRIQVEYGIIENGGTAVIETAAASGLTLLTAEERDPMMASTFGTGELIADAVSRGCRKILVGLGGSATNDGGLGMLSALGYRFLDSEGNILPGCGSSLSKVASVDDSGKLSELTDTEFIVACDVKNPLYGPDGAAYVFAPQKGADRKVVEELDKGLRHFSGIIRDFCGKDISSMPGAGAAGGLGGAFMAFLNSRITSGIDMVLDAVQFDRIISGADLIITGEGKIDRQTGQGKTPLGILQRANNQGIKTTAIGGIVEFCDIASLGFDAVIQVTPADMPIEEAMQPETAKINIKKAIKAYLMSEGYSVQNVKP